LATSALLQVPVPVPVLCMQVQVPVPVPEKCTSVQLKYQYQYQVQQDCNIDSQAGMCSRSRSPRSPESESPFRGRQNKREKTEIPTAISNVIESVVYDI